MSGLTSLYCSASRTKVDAYFSLERFAEYVATGVQWRFFTHREPINAVARALRENLRKRNAKG